MQCTAEAVGNMSERTQTDLFGLKLLAEQQLLTIPGVVGLGIGFKETSQELLIGAAPAWRVYVAEKKAKRKLPISQRIPKSIHGVWTDVIEHRDSCHCAWHSVEGAGSMVTIANNRGVPGTIGCIAETEQDRKKVLLSNYHVLFGKGGQRDELVWYVELHGPTGQKLTKIGETRCGCLSQVVHQGSSYFVDCAIADLCGIGWHRYRNISTALHISGVATAELGMTVEKVGGATNKTTGIIVDIAYPDKAHHDGISYDAPNQILVHPVVPASDTVDSPTVFSAAGDSGAAIVNTRKEIVALLWGTNSRGEGIACHIVPVLQAMDISICKTADSGFGILIDALRSSFSHFIARQLERFAGTSMMRGQQQ